MAGVSVATALIGPNLIRPVRRADVVRATRVVVTKIVGPRFAVAAAAGPCAGRGVRPGRVSGTGVGEGEGGEVDVQEDPGPAPPPAPRALCPLAFVMPGVAGEPVAHDKAQRVSRPGRVGVVGVGEAIVVVAGQLLLGPCQRVEEVSADLGGQLAPHGQHPLRRPPGDQAPFAVTAVVDDPVRSRARHTRSS